MPWRKWLETFFAHICKYGFGKRHENLWQWVDSLQPGVRPKAFIAIWPRAGGKSTTGELAASRVCAKLSRRFMMIVSSTQDQANQRVGAISEHFEHIGVKRALNQFGNSKGWRVDILRTDNGFNVLAYGLDSASRGVKLGEFRPDLIWIDDIDALLDTPETTAKKIQTLTKTVLPTGSEDCAVAFVQNRILEFGVMGQLKDGIAEFLLDREPISEEPAIVGLKAEPYEQADGRRLYRIIAGTPTWEGQSIEACENFINTFGPKAFAQECQHEVKGAEGVFFKADELRTIAPDKVPEIHRACLAGDFAATEGGGNYTALALIGSDNSGRYYVFAVIRGQWSTERVNEVIEKACAHYLPHLPNASLRLPQDPAAAGKRVAAEDEKRFARWQPNIVPVTGKKADRAKDLSEQVNVGNVYLVEQNLPEWLGDYVEPMFLGFRYWHAVFKDELRKFREDEKHERDDQVDAAADAFNEVNDPVQVHFTNYLTGRRNHAYPKS